MELIVNTVGKIAEKAVCRSVFLTINKKRTPSDYLFWRFCPLGVIFSSGVQSQKKKH